jgi:flavin-dependent dehydrogenase
MQLDHDLVIAGGGPAGLSTALFAVAADPSLARRLVVLEKEVYPRDKPCAGAIGGRADAVLARAGAAVSVPSVPVSGFAIEMPDGSFTRRDRDRRAVGRVVRRIEFDARLAEIARERGITVQTGVRVLAVRPDADGVTVETSAGSLRTRALVGADGVGSVVRRALAPRAATWRAQVLEVDTPIVASDPDRDLLRFRVPDSIYNGYLWDFPTVVAGEPLVCRGVYHLLLPGQRAGAEDLAARLDAHLAARGLSLRAFPQKRYAERGFALHEPHSAPRVLLVGEAAGVDPITGEGIAQAILYGQVAGRYLAERLRTSDLSFSDWRRHLLGTGLGVDLAIRHVAAHAFFGPERRKHEARLLAAQDVVEAGAQYFGGHVPRASLVWRVGRALVRQKIREIRESV